MFRSGTNFTRTIMEWNYHCKLTTDMLGWKHGFYPVIVERSELNYPVRDIIFVTKNPFSSINSLYNYYQTNGRNIVAPDEWKAFLRQRFAIYDFFQENSPQYRFANVVDYWNSINWNFSSVQKTEFSTTHVKYEDMLENTIQTAQSIANKLKLKPRFDSIENFRIPEKITKNMGDKMRTSDADYLTNRAFNKNQYSNKDYYQRFDIKDIAFVIDNIDMDLVALLGYSNEIAAAQEKLK